MEYLRIDDDRIQTRLTVTADWDAVTPSWGGRRTERIRDALVGVAPALTEYRTSSRAMWPDTELKGVEIGETGPILKGKITLDGIEFTVPGTASISEGHGQLEKWFDEAELDLPDLDAFNVKMIAFDTDDGWAITTDPSKCENHGVLGQCSAEVGGTRVEYAAVNVAGAYLSFPDGLDVADAPDITVEFLWTDRFLIGDADAVEKDGGPDWC